MRIAEVLYKNIGLLYTEQDILQFVIKNQNSRVFTIYLLNKSDPYSQINY